MADQLEDHDEERPVYDNKIELILSLVGYAVGLGNIWRFPSLVFANGGAAFMIPYFLSLFLLALPLMVLEMGLGQMLRQGTLGVWNKLGLSQLRGIGMAATITAWFVGLYYNTIIAWAWYYLFRTFGAMFSGGSLPWTDDAMGCGAAHMYTLNGSDVGEYWCPATGLPGADAFCADGYFSSEDQTDTSCANPLRYTYSEFTPAECPARAALNFFVGEALQISSGLTDFGGLHMGQFACFTLSWIVVYFCIFKGINSSGKVVYVTATLPYFVLIFFLIRALTLENAGVGVRYFVAPDLSKLADYNVWTAAANQIFYSLGPGFGGIIAFASYGRKQDNFVKDSCVVAGINSGTSIIAGFVVFPILAFLASELKGIDPCFETAENLDDLSGMGLISGPMLAFVAFPIAVSEMPFPYLWAILFFVMIICLGLDSMFAIIESVVTVLRDAGVGSAMPREIFTAIVCLISWLCGIVFTTRAGIYWIDLFDGYVAAVSIFFVAMMECIGVVYFNRAAFDNFLKLIKENTEVDMLSFPYQFFTICWKYVAPLILFIFFLVGFFTFDRLGAAESEAFPMWSIFAGWFAALLPLFCFVVIFFRHQEAAAQREFISEQELVSTEKPAESSS